MTGRRRLALLAFIRGEIEAGRPFPTQTAIASAMGWKGASGVSDALWALVKDGHLIATRRGRYFAWSLNETAPGGSGQTRKETP